MTGGARSTAEPTQAVAAVACQLRLPAPVQATGFKAQNNTLTATTNPVFVARPGAPNGRAHKPPGGHAHQDR